jgi:hypothetical protein
MMFGRLLLYSCFSLVVLGCESPVKQCPPLQYRYGKQLIQFPITVEQAKRNYGAPFDLRNVITDHPVYEKSTLIVYYANYQRDTDSTAANDTYRSVYAVTINKPVQPDSVRLKLSADFKKPVNKKRWSSSEWSEDYYMLRINECNVVLIHRSFTSTTPERPWVVTFGYDFTDVEAERFVRRWGDISAFDDYLK